MEAMLASTLPRRLPVGAEVLPDGETHFRLWAPDRRRVDLVLEDNAGEVLASVELAAEDQGYFSGVAAAPVGSLYRFRCDGAEERFPDPASRFQPLGVHGPSQVVYDDFAWSDGGWEGLKASGQVLYELHIGTFTPKGDWRSAAAELPRLAELGITAVEVMPVAEFPGRFGWGYDGVYPFAPTRLYGQPDDFRHFVNSAHLLGIGVILDVVYNHLGPVGNYFGAYAQAYFSRSYRNEWAEALNFDGPDSGPVREYFCANARYWASDFHLDGLRLDATQQIFDASPRHIICEIGQAFRQGARERPTLIVAENESQHAELVRPVDQEGLGLDAIWNDDFHHAARVMMTGRREAYYSDYTASPQEFVSCAKRGFLFQGQFYSWQSKDRGSPTIGLGPENFVTYLENHDQVANSTRGARLIDLTSPDLLRTFTTLLLLGPGIPMLFQGQEFGSRRPFQYFADCEESVAASVRSGRMRFLSQFPSIAGEGGQQVSDPLEPATFEACRLSPEGERLRAIEALHHDLIRLRRTDLVLHGENRQELDGAVLGSEAFALRYFGIEGDDRLLLVNLGTDLERESLAEPLVAPPKGRHWAPTFSSDSVRYGGRGALCPFVDGRWQLVGRCATLLTAVERDE
jgi:maltooligosyltrehalose trehalohydrolase